MIFVDRASRVALGLKRHAYEDHDTYYERVCGNTTGRGGDVRQRSQLTKLPEESFATDPNSCNTCIDSLGLTNIKRSPQQEFTSDSTDFTSDLVLRFANDDAYVDGESIVPELEDDWDEVTVINADGKLIVQVDGLLVDEIDG